jgi:Fe-S-cluster containining protein
MKELERFKEEILKDYPRMSEDDSFAFACHSGVPCFNDCCGDVNIFLTPYDIIRLKNALGMTSSEFLAKYTISPFDQNLKYPVVLLQMIDDEKKSCPFVTEEGCRVYEDRPWSCRMYPLGLASPQEGSKVLDEEFYFLLKEAVCKGYEEEKKWTVSEWLEDQGIREFDEMGQQFKEITLHRVLLEGKPLTPEKIEMFFMVCYNIDNFRNFLFGSTFFEKFDVDDDVRKKIQEDDVELLKFGFRWLRFALFAEETMKVKEDILEAKKEELADKIKESK